MLFKSNCEIAANSILGMDDTLELNWKNLKLYIDGKGRDLYHKKDKFYQQLQTIIVEVKNKYSDADLDVLDNKNDIELHTNRLMEVRQRILDIVAP